jgi:AmmeMemoRadiSam system protein B
MNLPPNSPAKVRPPAVAGRFYPADPAELRGMVESFLAAVPIAKGPSPKAVIAPHAGYPYSGPIAASAFAQFAPDREIIKRIILVGPSHFVAFNGLALPWVDAFATPLGVVPLDSPSLAGLRELPEVIQLNGAHDQEHCLEVQLPFLQVVLGEFRIIPLVAGQITPEALGRVLQSLWGGAETRVVISSDLSHYLSWAEAHELDTRTAKAIESLSYSAIYEHQACGHVPICGMLRVAQNQELAAETLDLRSSGDTSGPRSRVVGYGAFAFCEPT